MKALRWSRWISQACTTVMFRRDKNRWRPHAIVRIGWEAGPLKNTVTHHLTITLDLLTLWEIGWSTYGFSWTHGYICSCCNLWTATHSGLAKCSLIIYIKKQQKQQQTHRVFILPVYEKLQPVSLNTELHIFVQAHWHQLHLNGVQCTHLQTTLWLRNKNGTHCTPAD